MNAPNNNQNKVSNMTASFYERRFIAALAFESTVARAWSTDIPAEPSTLPLNRTTLEPGSMGSNTLLNGS
jgi:hypothetical protein